MNVGTVNSQKDIAARVISDFDQIDQEQLSQKLIHPTNVNESMDEIKHSVIDQQSDQFGLSVQKLKTLTSHDNNITEKVFQNQMPSNFQVKYPDRLLSTKILMEELGGNQGVLNSLSTTIEGGIQNLSVRNREKIFGRNQDPDVKIRGLCELIMENFEDKINQILLVAAIVSIVIGLIKEGFPDGLVDGVSIAMALVIITVVSSINNLISERKLAKLILLNNVQRPVMVIRERNDMLIEIQELVVGDIYHVKAGSQIPAESLYLHGGRMLIDESELTGESAYVDKLPATFDNQAHGADPILLKSTHVQEGNGLAVVLAVGKNTIAGQISEKMCVQNEPTPLQQNLEILADQIGKFGLAAAVMTFIFVMMRLIFELLQVIPCGCQNLFDCQPNPGCLPLTITFKLSNPIWTEILDALIISIAIIVVAIPEGLPLAVTISLSYSSKQMTMKHNLVRRLESCETMGSATYICTDKTGTLTKNEMTVVAFHRMNQVFELQHFQDQDFTSKQRQKQFHDQCSQNLSFLLHQEKSITQIFQECMIASMDGRIRNFQIECNSATDYNILKFLADLDSMSGLQSTQDSLISNYEELSVNYFDSNRKRSSIILRNPKKQGTESEVRVYCKGAPDFLLPRASSILINEKDGIIKAALNEKTSMSEQDIVKYLKCNEKDNLDNFSAIDYLNVSFAKKAYRNILLTFRDMSMVEFNKISQNVEEIENNLTVLGLVSLQDPLRDEITKSIKQCQASGVKVVMCTGDNLDTAKAIAFNAGIISKHDFDNNSKQSFVCMTGTQFRDQVGGISRKPSSQLNNINLDSDQSQNDSDFVEELENMNKFVEIKDKLKVLARSTPSDKYSLVTGLQRTNEVVAVTGDGTNDAPALRKSHVGFAMLSGTTIAQASSDIILMDNNFASIITALLYGRSIYDNVRKFIQFQLTVNVAALVIVLIGSLILRDSPLTAVQMLWVNLIMDSFAALALATEPPLIEILERMPYKKNAPLITSFMWRNIIGHSIYQVLVLVLVIFLAQTNDWLVFNYSHYCLQYQGTTQTHCLVYNPHHTKSLYWTKEEVDQWKYLDSRNMFGSKVMGMRVPEEDQETQKLLHHTLIFQTFVFMQLFNWINARKLEGELNVFKHICNNSMFFTVLILTLLIQVALVQIGGKATQTQSLTLEQNMFCILFGFIELPWALIIKCILPLSLFKCKQQDV